MDTFTLTRTGDAPLQFAGDLIASAGGAGHNRNRWHTLTLYRRADAPDQYVLQIAYGSQWAGELEHTLVESGTMAHLRDTLRGYDPTAHLLGYPPGPQYAEKQARVARELRLAYQHAVSELLAGFPVEA